MWWKELVLIIPRRKDSDQKLREIFISFRYFLASSLNLVIVYRDNLRKTIFEGTKYACHLSKFKIIFQTYTNTEKKRNSFWKHLGEKTVSKNEKRFLCIFAIFLASSLNLVLAYRDNLCKTIVKGTEFASHLIKIKILLATYKHIVMKRIPFDKTRSEKILTKN